MAQSTEPTEPGAAPPHSATGSAGSAGFAEIVWHHEMSHVKFIAAPPELVWQALVELRLADLVAARPLFWIRGVPARLRGREFAASETIPMLEGVARSRFSLITFDEPKLIEIARIARFWELVPTNGPIVTDRAEFAAFAEPDFAKAVMSIELTPQAAGTRVVTATRISATDDQARRKFGRYWALIRLGSATIRRAMLTEAARRAAELAAAPS